MTAVYILTEYEVHQIAYLTQNGWEANPKGEWRKAGKTHTVTHSDGETRESDVWELDDAYWEEQP